MFDKGFRPFVGSDGGQTFSLAAFYHKDLFWFQSSSGSSMTVLMIIWTPQGEILPQMEGVQHR